MLDLSDSNDDESNSQCLPPNPELTDFYELTQLKPMPRQPPPDEFLEFPDLKNLGPLIALGPV